MKLKFTSMLMIALVAIMFVSCSKDDDKDKEEAPTTAANGFTWKENGSTTVQTATTATFSTQYKTIMASTATGSVFEINLSGTTPATYTLNSSNVITYTKVTPFFVPSTGNVIITANANGKVSGTFQGTGTTTSGISSVSGTFTNINVVP
jgi:glutamate 5-kinase